MSKPPATIRKDNSSEKTETPSNTANIILEPETMEPSRAVIYLYPEVINTWPRNPMQAEQII